MNAVRFFVRFSVRLRLRLPGSHNFANCQRSPRVTSQRLADWNPLLLAQSRWQ